MTIDRGVDHIGAGLLSEPELLSPTKRLDNKDNVVLLHLPPWRAPIPRNALALPALLHTVNPWIDLDWCRV